MDFPSGPVVKNPPASAGDTGSIPAPGSSHVGPCATTTEPVLPNKREEQEKNRESEVAQSCLTLCDPMDCSLAGSSIHMIFQARVLEWVAMSFSRGSSQLRDRTQVSCTAGRCLTVWATREAQQEKPPQWQAKHHNRKSSAYLLQLEKTCVHKWRCSTGKNKIKKFFILGLKLNNRRISPFHIEKRGGK